MLLLQSDVPLQRGVPLDRQCRVMFHQSRGEEHFRAITPTYVPQMTVGEHLDMGLVIQCLQLQTFQSSDFHFMVLKVTIYFVHTSLYYGHLILNCGNAKPQLLQARINNHTMLSV